MNVPWRVYERRLATIMRPYIPGEDLSGISVSDVDNPKLGDMIARHASNHKDKWLVSKEYFETNYEVPS